MLDFKSLHTYLEGLYSAECCHVELDNKNTRNNKYNRVKAAFSKAAEYIRSQKGLKVSHFDSKPVQNLVKETNAVLQDALQSSVTHEIPAAALEMYKNDIFIFSGMKSFAALKEASGLILDDKGNIKPLYQFRKDIEPLKDAHYHRYIDVEYNFCKASVQSAAQFHEYQKDGDRYDWQIRTAMDDHVRQSHQALQNLTLPASDPFWKTHWTPFDWGCRCRIIQVLKGKYTVTDSDTATQLGNQAVREEFRYNPGINGVVFPPKHPYYAQHCNGNKLSISLIGQVRIVLENESDKCGWQKKLDDQIKNTSVNTKPLSREEKDKIFILPIEEQWNKIDIEGKTVFVHKAYSMGDDYNDLLKACGYFIDKNQTPCILPIIHANDKDFRNKIFSGYDRKTKSPDLFIKELKEYWEVEHSAGTSMRNVNQRIKGGLEQADNVYLLLDSDQYEKTAKEKLQKQAKDFHIDIKKENQH